MKLVKINGFDTILNMDLIYSIECVSCEGEDFSYTHKVIVNGKNFIGYLESEAEKDRFLDNLFYELQRLGHVELDKNNNIEYNEDLWNTI